MKTVRLTMAQAMVRFLENQYIAYDGKEQPFVEGVIMLPGHGNVVGLGQALGQEARRLTPSALSAAIGTGLSGRNR